MYFAAKYCDYGRVNYNMLRDIQMELKKLKYKGADIGKCLTDGFNKSFSFEETFRYILSESLKNEKDLFFIFTWFASASNQLPNISP